RLSNERRERGDGIDAHLAAREDTLVDRFFCEVLADPQKRFEVDAFPPKAWGHTIAAAVRPFSDVNGFPNAEPVLFDQRRDVFGKAGAPIHGLDREMTCRKLALSLQRQIAVALFQNEREPFLIVDAARRSDLEDREAGLRGARSRNGVSLDLV